MFIVICGCFHGNVDLRSILGETVVCRFHILLFVMLCQTQTDLCLSLGGLDYSTCLQHTNVSSRFCLCAVGELEYKWNRQSGDRCSQFFDCLQGANAVVVLKSFTFTDFWTLILVSCILLIEYHKRAINIPSQVKRRSWGLLFSLYSMISDATLSVSTICLSVPPLRCFTFRISSYNKVYFVSPLSN